MTAIGGRLALFANQTVVPSSCDAATINQILLVKSCLEPRTFKLYEELEGAEKGTGDPACSLGLDDANDQTFTTWNASIIGQHGNFDGRFLSIRVVCGEDYPNCAPVVKFVNKVNLPCVGADGTVNLA